MWSPLHDGERGQKEKKKVYREKDVLNFQAIANPYSKIHVNFLQDSSFKTLPWEKFKYEMIWKTNKRKWQQQQQNKNKNKSVKYIDLKKISS